MVDMDDERYEVLNEIEDLSCVQTIRDIMGSQGAVIGRAYPIGTAMDAPTMAARIERWADKNLTDSDREVTAKHPRNPGDDHYIVKVR